MELHSFIKLADFTFTGTVTSANGKQEFTDISRAEEKNYFTKGVIKFLTGENSGVIREVANFSEGKFKLLTPLTKEISVGDTYQVSAGCDKLFPTCISKFNNAINFRGEPHIPGTDRVVGV